MPLRRPALVALAVAVCAAGATAARLPPLSSSSKKAELTSRFLQQVSDLGLWAGTIACSEDDQAPYTVSRSSAEA